MVPFFYLESTIIQKPKTNYEYFDKKFMNFTRFYLHMEITRNSNDLLYQ